jgi:hypothetical protein
MLMTAVLNNPEICLHNSAPYFNMMLLYVHIVDMYFKNYVHILTVAWWILKYILSSAVTVPQYVYKV